MRVVNVCRRFDPEPADDVPAVMVRAHRGEIVLRPGEVITERHHLLVSAIKVQQARMEEHRGNEPVPLAVHRDHA